MEEEEETIEEPRVPIRRAHVEEEVNLSILDLLYMMEGHNMVFHQYKDGYVQTMWGTTNISQQSVKALMDPLKAVCVNKVCKWDHSVTMNYTTNGRADYFTSSALRSSKWADRLVGWQGHKAIASKFTNNSIRICVDNDCKIFAP
jgi:hypothetical protein